MTKLHEDLSELSGLIAESGDGAAAKLLQGIRKRLGEKDGIVQISTSTKSWVYTHKHRDMFRLSKDGKSVMVQRGRKWDDISYTNVRFGRFQ